ncbi:MAG: hypothetical protein QM820_23450 [Minicystis sp.]
MDHYGPHDPWLIPFLSTIKGHPATYTGDWTVESLQRYMLAYGQARLDLGFPEFGTDEEELLSQFDEWLVERLKVARVSSGPGCAWAWYVKSVDPSPDNVETFFALFEEFLASIGRRLPKPRELVKRWPPARGGAFTDPEK